MGEPELLRQKIKAEIEEYLTENPFATEDDLAAVGLRAFGGYDGLVDWFRRGD